MSVQRWQYTTGEEMHKFMHDLDKYPFHFIGHLFQAIAIIGWYHPDNDIRAYYNQIYLDYVKALHLNPETKEQNDLRLCDGVDSD